MRALPGRSFEYQEADITHSPNSSPTRVILLGEDDTVARREQFSDHVTEHGCLIADAFGFAEDEVNSARELTDVDAVVAALGRAIVGRMDIWLPFPGRDFAQEQHWRRLSLVLQRHGLNLREGRDVYPCPIAGGFSEIDFALRREVQAVDALDQAALAAVGAETLGREIELALSAGVSASRRRVCAEGDVACAGGFAPPTLPAPTAPWPQRLPLLKRYVRWLVNDCGVTQAATARVLNSTGQRTATGRKWQPGTVSKLLNGNYDHAATGSG